MDLSIIIVSYNVKDLLRNCLNSVLQTTSGISYEIFVVDNNSSDGSTQMVKTEFPKVNLMENNKNLGFAKANNQAITQCKGRYILLLNPDCIVLPNSINLMIRFIEANESIAILGPDLLAPDGTVHPSVCSVLPNLWSTFLQVFKFKSLLPSSPRLRKYCVKYFGFIVGETVSLYLEPYSDRRFDKEVQFIPGTSMLVRRQSIDRVGLLDENFFLYVEDADWCLRMKKMGWKIWHFPEPRIIHYAGSSSNNSFRELSPEAYKAKYYFFLKHYGRRKEMIARAIVISGFILKTLLLLTHRPIKSDEKHIITKQLKQYFDIIKGAVCYKSKHY